MRRIAAILDQSVNKGPGERLHDRAISDVSETLHQKIESVFNVMISQRDSTWSENALADGSTGRFLEGRR